MDVKINSKNRIHKYLLFDHIFEYIVNYYRLQILIFTFCYIICYLIYLIYYHYVINTHDMHIMRNHAVNTLLFIHNHIQ